ncbi:hypothetical protein GCM10009846_02110 [Agrococcus versicolor]|uniref:RNA polymerase sigma-70 region 2 domain-containing protein n=1 Tax=Agrococcus versicolor TaxID=501482 RepID=A0ABN3AJ22_9MICO
MTLELHEAAAIRALLRDEWDALQPRLVAIAQRIVRRREVAEDVVSSTVVELIERVDAGEVIREPAAYLARGVRFRAIDVVRSRDGQAVVGTEVADAAIASMTDARLGAMAVDDLDALAPVREAFGALSQRHRDVLTRTVIDEQPLREVARAWGMTPNAVAVLALRARRALRAELKAVLMERAGGACATHARSSSRAALAHAARCSHCRDVRSGRGTGRWVLGLLPPLLGVGAAVLSPARSAHAAVAAAVQQPAVALSSLAVTAVATTAIVVGVGGVAPFEAPSPVAAPSAVAPTAGDEAPAADAVDQADGMVAPAPVAVEQSVAPTLTPTTPTVAPPSAIGGSTGPAVSPTLASAPAASEPPAAGALANPADPVTPAGPVTPAPPEAPGAREPTEPTGPGRPGPVVPIDLGPSDPLEPTVPIDLPDPDEPTDPVVPDPPAPPPSPPQPPAPAAPPSAATSWLGGSLLVLPVGTVALSGLVPGATYDLALDGGMLAIASASGGLSCELGLGAMTTTCVASADTATVTIAAADLLVCGLPATLTVAARDAAVQQPLVATLGPVTCL